MTLAIRKRKPLVSKRFPAYSTMDKLLSEIWDEDYSGWGKPDHQKTTQIQSNIIETQEGFVIEMALPGYSKKEVTIELDENSLHISSIDSNEKSEDISFRLREFYKAPFKRSFSLSNSVDQDKISAEFNNGILTIELAKKAELKPRSIHVK